MTIASIISIALVIAVVLVLGKFFVGLLALAIPLIIAGIVLLLFADTITGGDALEQLATKLSNWIKARTKR